MHPFICAICWSRSGRPDAILCESCVGQLQPVPARSGVVTSLYFYQDILREFILRIKIGNDVAALRAGQRLFVSSTQALTLGGWADIIVPAPSSLWGRLRGRIDLAWHLAKALASACDTTFIPSPLHLYWCLRKRARSRERSEIEVNLEVNLGRSTQNQKSPDGEERRVLIVDDVVTTGATLLRVANACPGACRFLTLARPPFQPL